ncbi:MAG: thymidylate synthase [Erythrobacter sp.]
MEIEQDSLDQAIYALYIELLEHGREHTGSRGKNRELLGVALRIRNPRARISISEDRGRPFSAIGELLWYLSGSDELAFIEPYIGAYQDDAVEGILEGAYGPRFFSMRDEIDQFQNIESLLTKSPGSRRAVIQLFNAEDIARRHKEIPCTTTLQFHLRDGQLHMSVTMRSNDAYYGLPHDVFCFTMLQEMMARRLQVELGEYYQYVGSMHLYEEMLKRAEAYIEEGVQQVREMPEMPKSDPFSLVDRLLEAEAIIRGGERVDASGYFEEPYWADFVRLIQAFWARFHADDHGAELDHLCDQMIYPDYRVYIDGRRHLSSRAP